MTDRELLQQALDALEDCLDDNVGWYDGALDLQRALRARLVQPELKNQCGETCERAKLCAICAQGIAQPEQKLTKSEVYRLAIQMDIFPPQHQPLTDDEIVDMWANLHYEDKEATVVELARAIEAAHNIK